MASTIRRISVSSAPQESARDLLEFDSGERHLLVRSMDGSYDAGGSAGSQVGSHSLWTGVDGCGHGLEIYGFGGWGLPLGGRCEFCGACHILRRSTPRPLRDRRVSCSSRYRRSAKVSPGGERTVPTRAQPRHSKGRPDRSHDQVGQPLRELGSNLWSAAGGAGVGC